MIKHSVVLLFLVTLILSYTVKKRGTRYYNRNIKSKVMTVFKSYFLNAICVRLNKRPPLTKVYLALELNVL